MNDEDLISEWIRHFTQETESFSPAYAELSDAVQDDPERAWRIILGILERDQSDNVISCLAGGPLEDLLVYHGRDFIERIESQAQTDERFNRLLGGVWKNAILDNVWVRLTAARKDVW